MLSELNYAYGKPSATGSLKNSPEDFCVEENLGFELTGEGEHLFLLIEKKLLNTEEMAKILAQKLKLPIRAISYAGMKDKYARTIQWFSLHLPGMDDPILDDLQDLQYRVLKAIRHNKKLKVGALKSNRFYIKVHNFNYDEADLSVRIQKVTSNGVPNYFGPQRFGNNGRNLERAKDLLLEGKKFKDRHLRGIYYSTARAFIFNEILSKRVGMGNWNNPLTGDVMMLTGSHSVFQVPEITEDIYQRIASHDISPAGVLWGEGKELLEREALEIQTQTLEPLLPWCSALEQHRLQKLYRSMVLVPEDLQFQENEFRFSLPSGAFATSVLREICLTL
jgi:tRNA pseudouridine13 synthase